MLGSTVQLRAGDDATTATVRSLTRNLDETLAIFAEKLLEPKFDPADSRVQQQTMQAIALSRDQAGATAQTVYDLLLLGRDNPVAHPDHGRAGHGRRADRGRRAGLLRRALLRPPSRASW